MNYRGDFEKTNKILKLNEIATRYENFQKKFS